MNKINIWTLRGVVIVALCVLAFFGINHLPISGTVLESAGVSGTWIPARAKKVLIVYPASRAFRGTSPQQEQDNAIMMQNLLGHFDVDVTLCTSQEYRKGQMEGFDAFFYVGTYQEKIPRTLLSDLVEWNGPTMWLGRNISQLSAFGGPEFITILPGRQHVSLAYDGKSLNSETPIRINLIKKFPEGAKVWAWADTNQGRWPFGVQKDNFWYIAAPDFHSKTYLLVANKLHDVLGFEPKGQRFATIRIEDVHPLRSPEALRRIADELKSRQVPFMVTVFPVYVNPKEGKRVHLREKPELVTALQYMEEAGGSILIHGYTHQVGNAESGLGFEFWDEGRESPIVPRQRPNWAQERLNTAIVDLRALGLHPRGMTVPHYAMARTTYKQMRENVELLAGCPQMSDQSRQTQKLPYLLHKDQYGYRVVPENLGYVDGGLSDPIAPMLQKAEEIAVVRDCAVGAFFHPFLDVKHLINLVEGLQERGFRFLDVRTLPVREVQLGSHVPSVDVVAWDPVSDKPDFTGSREDTFISRLKVDEATSETITLSAGVFATGGLTGRAIRRRGMRKYVRCN